MANSNHKTSGTLALLLCVVMSGCASDSSTPDSKDLLVPYSDELKVKTGSETISVQESEARKEEIRLIIRNQKAKALAKKNSIPPPGADPLIWIMDAQSVYGEFADPSTVFLVTDEGNCGGKGGGCAVHPEGPDGPVILYISPSGIGDTQLLFHEIAHSKGITDECMADKWAHTVTDIVEWKYPECGK